jgi:ribosomal protein L22
MNHQIVQLKALIDGKFTYTSWSTNSSYMLKSKGLDNQNILVYYITKSNKVFSREFPKFISITPKFACILGLIKGEGANALGKSNYRRFTFTNSDCELVKKVLDTLIENKLLMRENLKEKSIYIMHYQKEESTVLKHWSRKLEFPLSKFRCIETVDKTRDYGICHVYVSDVLLRRVIDIMIDSILN